mgnify:CR=1 FL=1
MSNGNTVSIVIDSDLFIDNLRGSLKAAEWFNSIRNSESFNIYYSALTEAEVLAGKDCEAEEKEEKVIALLSIGKKMLVTNDLAKLGGTVRRKYGLALVDAIIAATALKIGAVLCTRNIADYGRIPDLRLKEPYN